MRDPKAASSIGLNGDLLIWKIQPPIVGLPADKGGRFAAAMSKDIAGFAGSGLAEKHSCHRRQPPPHNRVTRHQTTSIAHKNSRCGDCVWAYLFMAFSRDFAVFCAACLRFVYSL